MKKISFFLILTALTFSSCHINITQEKFDKNTKTVMKDSCEYVVYIYAGYTRSFGLMSHAGDCKNPIHKNEKTN